MIRSIALAASIALLAGCTAPPTRYAWGSYEELIYATYAAPGKLPAESQVEIMEKEFGESRSANKPVPPGWHAQLGYLYFQLGKADQARQELLTEKANFPESGVFMDRLLANMEKH